ncbi:LytR/AlgR family response regulator transcription factor [Anaerosacchariphilus polymeriproducens]|uniref:Stage 0 sporulation protein A homolog n=1 Tax=Anaerosacchariphilus polymeriproducens TaxID=1812858 RepID=A0A371AQN8_9FIRM|nr:LytTR family DNA-binding domain-containing protein [Anaerosacchariphilus polymeriproducens]RDU21888.1 DNA-binding response regulator [Anaerosacchariphilus polymeriproducens]
MKIAICEDEQVWNQFIEQTINDYLILYKTVAEVLSFVSGELLLESGIKFDLIFLDEEMKGLSGLETAKRIRKIDEDVKIVFFTSHTDIMQKAFHVNTYRFLDKKMDKQNIFNCLDDYFHDVKNEKYLEIDVQGVEVMIRQKDIVYITAIRNGTLVYCKNETLVAKYTLKEFEERLNQELFYRCHRNTIVNISFIDWIDEKIILFGGYKVKCSQRRKAELKQLYTQYLIKYAR